MWKKEDGTNPAKGFGTEVQGARGTGIRPGSTNVSSYAKKLATNTFQDPPSCQKNGDQSPIGVEVTAH